MTGNNAILNIRMFVLDICNAIGFTNIYSKNNSIHPTAPETTLVPHISIFVEYIKSIAYKFGKIDKIYILEDKEVSSSAVPAMHAFRITHEKTLYIILNGRLNHCWKRFALVKELCSFYIDYFLGTDSQNAASQEMSKIYTDFRSPIADTFDETKAFKNLSNLTIDELNQETISIIMALELLIPIETEARKDVKELIKKIDVENGITANDVAKSLLIPEFLLEHTIIGLKLLDIEPQYHDFGNYK